MRVSGSQAYPTETRSDAFGQMAELNTWQDFVGSTGKATTSWAYDPATGLLLEKQYANLKKVQYQFDAARRLAKRTWARGNETTYTYTAAGSPASVTYSDTTPAVTYSYDRNGQMLSAGGYSYTYDPVTLLSVSETIPVSGTAPEATRVITRKRDALLRESGMVLDSGATLELETTWGYDNAGRPKTVTAQGRTFIYDYVAGRPELLSTVNGPVHTVVNTWEPLRGVLMSKANQRTGPSAAAVSAYEYAINSLGQRTSVRTAGEAFSGTAADWNWSYNPKGELISAANPADQTRNQVFRYDDIGNRVWVAAGAQPLALDNPQTEPTGGSITRYTANALNQYTAIDASAPTYDDDGNMLDDGTLLYVWDGENRLTAVKRKSDQALLAAYSYDHRSRRVAKATTIATPQGAAATAFVYDGWNVIAEYSIAGGHGTLNATEVWGTDLSGSQQGAGGVGGLLTRATGGIALHYAFDANGNVTELFDGTGAVAAHYEYSPFGEPLRATGIIAETNPFRFSTKYTDGETGLLYYGYRYYSASNGRWSSRDPIAESGDINIYSFGRNEPVGSLDRLGLWTDPARKGQSWAKTCAQQGDTWASLANMLSLEVSEASAWVKGYETTPTVGKSYGVPNTIMAFTTASTGWGGSDGLVSTSNFFRRAVMQAADKYERKGYRVDRHFQENMPSAFYAAWQAEGIYGSIFAGHGALRGGKYYGFTVGNDRIPFHHGEHEENITPDQVEVKYHLARVFALSCGSALPQYNQYAYGPGDTGLVSTYWKSKVSKLGRFTGFDKWVNGYQFHAHLHTESGTGSE